jgi:hypothetical protein
MPAVAQDPGAVPASAAPAAPPNADQPAPGSGAFPDATVAGIYEIALDNDYIIHRQAVERWNRTSRTFDLMETAPIAEGWISATEGGPPIHADLKTDLVFGPPGDVDGEIQGEAVRAHLEDLVGTPVFDVVRISSGAGTTDYLDARKIVVVRSATPRRS